MPVVRYGYARPMLFVRLVLCCMHVAFVLGLEYRFMCSLNYACRMHGAFVSSACVLHQSTCVYGSYQSSLDRTHRSHGSINRYYVCVDVVAGGSRAEFIRFGSNIYGHSILSYE